jgi:hypothetical protein
LLSTSPGAMLFTLIPDGYTLVARDLVKPITPALSPFNITA